MRLCTLLCSHGQSASADESSLCLVLGFTLSVTVVRERGFESRLAREGSCLRVGPFTFSGHAACA